MIEPFGGGQQRYWTVCDRCGERYELDLRGSRVLARGLILCQPDDFEVRYVEQVLRRIGWRIEGRGRGRRHTCHACVLCERRPAIPPSNAVDRRQRLWSRLRQIELFGSERCAG